MGSCGKFTICPNNQVHLLQITFGVRNAPRITFKSQ